MVVIESVVVVCGCARFLRSLTRARARPRCVITKSIKRDHRIRGAISVLRARALSST